MLDKAIAALCKSVWEATSLGSALCLGLAGLGKGPSRNRFFIHTSDWSSCPCTSCWEKLTKVLPMYLLGESDDSTCTSSWEKE